MKMIKLGLIFSFTLMSLQGFAGEYKKIGTFLLEYSIFKIDVYQISYFKSDTSEKLLLDYKTDVKKKYSLKGWEAGLKHKLTNELNREKAQWLFDHTVDVKEGDTLSLVRTGDQIEILKNDKSVAKTIDPITSKLAFEPWLGERPVSEELKKALLANIGGVQ